MSRSGNTWARQTQVNSELGDRVAIINYFASGALPAKMLLVRIIENNEIDAYLF